jgi:hypothetical protein
VRYEVIITEKSKCGGVYSTPDKVTFDGPIVLDERTWEWLTRSVHIYNVREIEWLR